MPQRCAPPRQQPLAGMSVVERVADIDVTQRVDVRRAMRVHHDHIVGAAIIAT